MAYSRQSVELITDTTDFCSVPLGGEMLTPHMVVFDGIEQQSSWSHLASCGHCFIHNNKQISIGSCLKTCS